MSISSLIQPPDATFSIFQEFQSCESEVLVWVSPNHSSLTRDLEKPILALPLYRIGPFRSLQFNVHPFNACQRPKQILDRIEIIYGKNDILIDAPVV